MLREALTTDSLLYMACTDAVRLNETNLHDEATIRCCSTRTRDMKTVF